jgi:antitoxin component YwqK of YwqJK toxin-antitoxin module
MLEWSATSAWGIIVVLGPVFTPTMCSGQVLQSDTTRDEHGRIVSTLHQLEDSDTRTHFWYHRSGELAEKRVEVEREYEQATWDTTWNKDGMLRTALYTSGDGWTNTNYNEQGIKLSTTVSGERGGNEYNHVTRFYANGAVRERYYEVVVGRGLFGSARFDSLHTLYSQDGALTQEMRYEDGKLHGVSTDYYPSGAIESIEVFDKGRLIGVRYFDVDGKELSIGDFYNGNGLLAVHKDGVQVSVCRYKDGRVVKRSCKCP